MEIDKEIIFLLGETEYGRCSIFEHVHVSHVHMIGSIDRSVPKVIG